MQEMTKRQVETLLGSHGLGVLALASEGEAYAIPLYYGRDDSNFYFRSRPGLKDNFTESTRRACLVVSRVESPDQWRSVQVFGPIKKVQGARARASAEAVLKRVPLPPEWQIPERETASRSGRDTYVWSLVAEQVVGRKSIPGID